MSERSEPTEDHPPGRTFLGMGPLSTLPAERGLQQVVIAMAVVGLGALLVYAGIMVFSGELSEAEPGESTSFSDSSGYDMLRLVVVVLTVLIALRLAQLAWRHRQQMRTVDGLRRQYLALCVFGCLLYSVFVPWPAFLIHAAVVVFLLTQRPVPLEQREGRITGGTFG